MSHVPTFFNIYIKQFVEYVRKNQSKLLNEYVLVDKQVPTEKFLGQEDKMSKPTVFHVRCSNV